MENLRLGGERMDFTEPVRVARVPVYRKDFLLRGTIAAGTRPRAAVRL
jgi:hypothetical protein